MVKNLPLLLLILQVVEDEVVVVGVVVEVIVEDVLSALIARDLVILKISATLLLASQKTN